MAGITPDGWVGKTSAEIRTELSDALKNAFGDQLNTGADSAVGNVIGAFADRLGELWELGGAIYAAFDPDTSTGQALKGLSALTGTTPEVATPSTVTVMLDQDAGSVADAGTLISVDGAPDRVFALDAELTNSASDRLWNGPATATAVENGPTEAPEGTLTVIDTPMPGLRAVTNGDVPARRVSRNAEPFALVNGQHLDVSVQGGAPNVVTFLTANFVSIGAALASEVAARINATATGWRAEAIDGRVHIFSNQEAVGGSLSVDAASNADALNFVEGGTVSWFPGNDAVPGQDEETDAQLRGRRLDTIDAAGSSTVETLRAKLLELTGMLDARVYENDTESTDGFGLPPKSFQVVVYGTATAADIARTIWENKPLGSRWTGAETLEIIDSQGVAHDVLWDEATAVPLYAEVEAQVVAETYAGDAALKAALVAYVDGLRIGSDVIALQAQREVMQVEGVHDLDALLLDDVDPPVAFANLSISRTQVPVLDEANIDVTVVEVIPS